MTDRPIAAPDSDAMVAYKTILKRVLDNRPSGTRQRLARALGKNRSFISQIANPAYPVPIPVQHLETMFELCHFSQDDRQTFLAAYRRAHPRRLALVHTVQRTRIVSLAVPDLGDAKRNRAVDALIADFVRRLRKFIDDIE
ncbi:MAG: hypothetical protein JOY64_07250 [Alphaproteobacteria bacterium]|nr:hypothetical protein [Alphaproteobacteria bacterium]MBV8407410.1 hypothetical protein [Alphaproteobacteria bacterium]